MPTNSQRSEEQGEIERLRAEIEQLKGENAQRKEEIQRGHEMYLRHLADFDNYRRRVEQERGSAAFKGKRQLIFALLDFLDDFERALAHVDESPESVSAGLLAIRRRLAGLLEAEGVTAFESVGQPFDPAQHEAVASVESDDQEPGTVLEELSRGYRWDRELLRPARVRVAR
ncbi:MAG TPA: nucleotide exchange factor GrpE [Blastocatellia bacterium]|nr:nucleotide exchange factor GrpE [Blastocatellia bacterium]